MESTSLQRVKQAVIAGFWASLASISVGFLFKLWLAQWVAKADLALYHTVIDIISLSLILMTGFRSSMVVAYSQTKQDMDITNIFRYCLIAIVLLTWGLVLPYIKHTLQLNVEYFQLVGIVLSMGFKVYFTNQIAMYRLYAISNKVTWLEPLAQVVSFLICFYALKQTAIASLFYSMTLSSLIIALYMYLKKRKDIATPPLGAVHFDTDLRSFMKKSLTASMEAGASILMIYITVLLTIAYFSIDELGDFQVVVRPMITYLTLLFVFPIYRFVLPEIAVCVREKRVIEVQQIKSWLIKISLLVSGLFFILMLFGSNTLIAWLFPEQYLKAAPVLLHFSMFFIFMMLNGYQLAYIKAHGYFTQSLLIRLAGIAVLVGTFYLYRLHTENVVAVILALGTGYLVMYLMAKIIERRIQRTIKND
ncbi:Membrane protein involved in the export of O-antigen and teichoic acid [Shewanella morhuae]|uniref:hypothetical protein n=1 Tax=Shewanella morhuae TaxID=365591 RepID=UPI00095582E7|nr:hypothetical protein [Shewanella morhuae]SIR06126.1 Membrane protein involved in the export of O-antigen and teichoic acid [Shewanella morhuae]